MSARSLRRIERDVPACRRCPRLARYLREQSERHPDYWSRPVPGFGDPRARLVIVGLAPGLHGANRTGRPFQGDASGVWLYDALARVGCWDGSALRDVYIANAVKCVPPGNLPVRLEQDRCRPWLDAELTALRHARVVLALGGIAHRAILKRYGVAPLSRHPFGHGVRATLPDGRVLLASYHPSRQNTNTGRLTRAMWSGVMRRARRLASNGVGTARPAARARP